ncbi:putative pap-specific phosphatase mitochondrial [Phtheirospermum japonicum]|uniref:Putative pap-specific phosphatase mitochondrial n=1 Tax=Phtheirospermum japonicum TaxID=374723 RepID=A0A830BAD4_9LAMI|nr:putative pap-specific phosphatase mitochondrial [Phtheirospermum japonicum]
MASSTPWPLDSLYLTPTVHTVHLSVNASSPSSVSLPFPEKKAKYYEHLQSAVDVVERACRLCVDVQKSLFSSDGQIIEKLDQTPVTIADFGVQALVSLEMGKLFPSIPLVAEEDSAFVRENNLVDDVVKVVTDKSSISEKALSRENVLKAIDRGGKDAYSFGPEPATYWILDPIDGTRGFVKGSGALYVVGLALVVEGEIVLGVMGCPNWRDRDSNASDDTLIRSGIIMISHVGCGTWRTRLWDAENSENTKTARKWTRCVVDDFRHVGEARFCIPESQTWESLPLSTNLCKYLMVASGRASVFVLRARTRTIIKVSDWKGSELDFAADQTERRVLYPSGGGVLVSNASLHNPILEIISSS